jgi:4'-phosphopantetheinyl transferase
MNLSLASKLTPPPLIAVFHARISRLRPEDEITWLAPTDSERLRCMSSPKRRRQFLAGRQLLRMALETIWPGLSLQFDGNVDQPPALCAWPGTGEAPLLGLSHSGDWVACLLSQGVLAGIDIEQLDPVRRRDIPGMAPEVLTQSEIARMSALEESAQGAFFYRCWTEKEALAKALGMGIALPFAKIGFRNGRIEHFPGKSEVEVPSSSRDPDWLGWHSASCTIGNAATLAVVWKNVRDELAVPAAPQVAEIAYPSN